jgi:F-type H+-transporting ATPase subunit a
MVFASGFTWWHFIPGVGDDSLLGITPMLKTMGLWEPHGYTQAMFAAWLVCVVTVLFAVFGRMALESAKKRRGIQKWYASPSVGILTVAEMVIEFWRSMMDGNLSRADQRAFMPIIAGMFLYVFLSNLLGMVPGFLPPTETVHNNWAMSICVFVLFVGVGVLRDPINFLKHLAGPVLALAPLIFAIELLGVVLRPATLTIRLTGNMFGDHTVFGIMSDLVPLGVPVAFLGLALVVSFIQAFVFSLLTVIYISLSVPHHDSDH